MINVTIDGKQIEVPAGTTVLRAAEAAGINIPTLCDHPQVSPYGGCRLCVVEVEGARTLQPSCTLPVSPNMVVHTDTERTREARKFVLTLLFSERNHFCMYCQVSGGDCELQNAAYGEGMTHWPLSPTYATYPLDSSHPYFVLEHNRCILCRRCVRACGELVGNFTLGFEERGAKSYLVADLGTPLGESTCVSCGTCVQICPTGALIDKRSAYRGRDAQVAATFSKCIGCSVGCGIEVKSRDNALVRVDGNWEDPLNDGVLCEVGRFTPVFETRERVVTPLVRKNGALKAATLDEALGVIAAEIKANAGKNGSGVAAFASSRLPVEALYTFKQLFSNGVKSSAVASLEDISDSMAAVTAARAAGQAYEAPLSALDDADLVFVMGEDLSVDHQVVGFMIKRMMPLGTKVIIADSKENKFAPAADVYIKVKADGYAELLKLLSAATGSPETQKAADLLAKAKKPVFVYGKDIGKALPALLEFAKAGQVIGLKGEANSLAAALLGYEPAPEDGKQACYYVALGDSEPNQRLAKKLEKAPFLAVQAAYVSPLTTMATVVIPVEMWAEQEGHFVNLEGTVISTTRVLEPQTGVLSNQAVLEQLAAKLGVDASGSWQEALHAVISPVAIHN